MGWAAGRWGARCPEPGLMKLAGSVSGCPTFAPALHPIAQALPLLG